MTYYREQGASLLASKGYLLQTDDQLKAMDIDSKG
jgi:hypothetical protein